MAKLSAHGRELGRLSYLLKDVAMFEDGHLLANHGHGWKLWRRAKDGLDPATVFAGRVEKLEAFDRERPAFAAYRRLLHDAATLGNGRRSMLHSAIQLMPGDPDGVWSEATDTIGGPRLGVDLEEVVALCRAYQAMIAEDKAQAPQVAVEA